MIYRQSYWRSHPKLKVCAKALARSLVVAYPTEAVWGFGADPFNKHAVEKVLRLKKRSASKGLIIAASNMAQLSFLLERLRQEQVDKLESRWPGPTTWLIPHFGLIPAWVSGDSDMVAVRVSAHPVVKALCESFGGPIISTSANVQGKRPARTALEVHRSFRQSPLVFAPGTTGGSDRPSEIRNLLTDELLRV